MLPKKPDDFVIATGKQYTKTIYKCSRKRIRYENNMEEKGARECGYFKGKKIIKIDPGYFRPTEVDSLIETQRKREKT